MKFWAVRRRSLSALGCVLYEPENARDVCEALSGFSGGKGPFYIIEEVFLVQFDEVTAVFYVGNDE